jgi:deazaflavin-dependent oxidoreductase (nitroreductase family)
MPHGNSVGVAQKREVHMPTKNDSLRDRLGRYREITISVTGRKSGQAISNPVWFVYDDGNLYLLPVRGSDTQWYKNVIEDPAMRIGARGEEADFKAVPITDAAKVSSIVEKFRNKYGAGDVKKYYSKFDVAVLAQTR